MLLPEYFVCLMFEFVTLLTPSPLAPSRLRPVRLLDGMVVAQSLSTLAYFSNIKTVVLPSLTSLQVCYLSLSLSLRLSFSLCFFLFASLAPTIEPLVRGS